MMNTLISCLTSERLYSTLRVTALTLSRAARKLPPSTNGLALPADISFVVIAGWSSSLCVLALS